MGFDLDFGETGFARDLFRMRFRRPRVDQETFAERYGLSFGMLRDQEQGRAKPSKAFKALLAAIELDPDFMREAA